MGVEWSILPVLAVILLATLIRSAFRFGEALVAVPLLALLMPVEEAVPLATLVSIAVAGIVLVQDWHKVHERVRGGPAALPPSPLPFSLLMNDMTKHAAYWLA